MEAIWASLFWRRWLWLARFKCLWPFCLCSFILAVICSRQDKRPKRSKTLEIQSKSLCKIFYCIVVAFHLDEVKVKLLNCWKAVEYNRKQSMIQSHTLHTAIHIILDHIDSFFHQLSQNMKIDCQGISENCKSWVHDFVQIQCIGFPK